MIPEEIKEIIDFFYEISMDYSGCQPYPDKFMEYCEARKDILIEFIGIQSTENKNKNKEELGSMAIKKLKNRISRIETELAILAERDGEPGFAYGEDD